MPLCRVAFQDLNFAHRFRKCRTRNGSELRWMPYGMPRFRQEMILTAFYLYGKNPRTGEIEGPCGTGVFIARDASADLQPCPPHCYAVTARHVVAEGASIIRLNTLLGKPVKQSTRLLEHEPHEWQFIEGGDDLAALDVTEEIWPDPDETHPSTDFIRGTHEKDFVTGEFIRVDGGRHLF